MDYSGGERGASLDPFGEKQVGFELQVRQRGRRSFPI
jgi:hypothetical protein